MAQSNTALTKPLHIFAPGRHVSVSGAELNFSEADLAASAKAYDPARHEAPLVVGHPQLNAPAYGWVKTLAAAPDGLSAEPQQVDAAFAEMVAAGRFKKISASFYAPDSPVNPVPGVYYLRHVGFLGAQPPAVKGLRNPEFAEAEEGVVEFSEVPLYIASNQAGLFRSLRDWLLGKFGQEAADAALPGWQVESLNSDVAREQGRQSGGDAPSFSETLSQPALKKEASIVTPEQKAALEAENASLKQKLAESEASFAELEKQKRETAAKARHAEHLAYAEKLEGVAPAHRDAVVAALDFAAGDGQSVVEFGEGDKKQPLATGLKAFLESLPPVVEFNETATKDKAATTPSGAATAEFAEKGADPQRLTLHAKATALSADGKLTYEQAVRQLINS